MTTRLHAIVARYRGRDLPPVVRTLGVTSFLQDVASDMVYPLLPLLLAGMGGGAAVFGIMESAADGVLALVKGWVGRRSDRTGRRGWVLAGYGLSAALRPILVFAVAAWQVVALRIADRVAKGLRTAPRDAMIADSVEPGRRAYAFSYHRGLDHLGAAVGPLLAAGLLWLHPGGLDLVFALATVPAVLGVAVLWRGTRHGVGETLQEEAGATPTPAEEGQVSSVLPRALWLPLAAVALFSLGNASDGFLLLLMHDVGYPAWSLPLVWSAFHIAKYTASVPGGRLADRTSHRSALIGGWLLYALVYAGLALFGASPWALALLLATYAVYYGLTEGAERALVVDLAAGRVGHGTSLGAFHTASGLGVMASSAVFGLTWQWFGHSAAFAVGAVLAAAAALLMLAGQRPRHVA